MSDIAHPTFNVRYDENNQEFSIIGSMRPRQVEEMHACTRLLKTSIALVKGTFYINVKR